MVSCVLLFAPAILGLWVPTVFGAATRLRFIGIGYNLLDGNPNGGEVSNGGIDPGLLTARKIFKLTYDEKKVSADGTKLIPDQVNYVPRSTGVNQTEKSIVSGAKSYQDTLKVQVDVGGAYEGAVAQAAFSLSASFEKIDKETKEQHSVFFETKEVRNLGRARYKMNLAESEGFPVTPDFAAAVCQLPNSYDDKEYFDFLNNWGTHVTTQVDLGTKTITRSKSSATEFTKYALKNVGASVSASGSYLGFSASLEVDVNQIRESKSTENRVTESTYSFTLGGDGLPEPIAFKILPIDRAFNEVFYSAAPPGNCSFTGDDMRLKREHILKALGDYATNRRAIIPTDPVLRVPLTWPAGRYGLPMPKSGCPVGTAFEWHEGTRYHDTEDSRSPRNSWSNPTNLSGYRNKDNMEQKFCMKTDETNTMYDMGWPEGKYCIFKKGDCPEGLREGSIKWDDEDNKNRNVMHGSLPDGQYDKDTRIHYCCRTDGYPENAIILPTDKPFFLFKSNSHLCQEVRGMRSTTESLFWDCQDTDTSNQIVLPAPKASVGRDIEIEYCYYTPIKQKVCKYVCENPT